MQVCFRLAAAAAAAVLLLASCSLTPSGSGPGTGTASAPAATVPAPGTTRPGTPEEPAPGTGTAGPDASFLSPGRRTARWGSFAGQREACLGVAANVAVLLLAPLSFLTEVDEEELAELKAQVSRTRHQVPKALKEDFAHLEEVLAENEDEEEFDEEALLEAVEPIRDWLAANCNS
ncbi:hypothetical protein [Arthrobacter mobilis]|uniref:Lipoprotein n=1 Tax=Arthrobacter mobilis TaxID=2724944 RepID=A0A7X6HDA9_9MICC|nr:hypothetical protein [Arthrobacter mobilis]NKX55018.1 hypothetical protein [Arthrobacter mobilis]